MRQVPRHHFLHQANAGLAAILIAAGSANAQQSGPITVRTDGMPGFVAATVLEKSRQGVEAVVQYLHRTRMIHALNPYDVVRREDRGALAEAPVGEAVASAESGK